MKRLALALLTLMLAIDLPAQRYYVKPGHATYQIHLSAHTTRSVYGVKTGMNFGFSLKERWGLAYFNHAGLASNEQERHNFRGINISYTINPGAKAQVGLNSYIGFYNRRFLALQQTIHLKYKISNKYFVVSELGRCDALPYFGFRAGIVLLSKH